MTSDDTSDEVIHNGVNSVTGVYTEGYFYITACLFTIMATATLCLLGRFFYFKNDTDQDPNITPEAQRTGNLSIV